MMRNVSEIEKAITIAANVHRGQKDKAGRPYILHPLRVMLSLEDETAMAAAVLHDAVEDGALSLDDLRNEGISEEAVSAVDCLSRRKEEDYDTYLDRIRDNPMATSVKLADLEDNMNIVRLRLLAEKDLDRIIRKYNKAWNFLRGG